MTITALRYLCGIQLMLTLVAGPVRAQQMTPVCDKAALPYAVDGAAVLTVDLEAVRSLLEDHPADAYEVIYNLATTYPNLSAKLKALGALPPASAKSPRSKASELIKSKNFSPLNFADLFWEPHLSDLRKLPSLQAALANPVAEGLNSELLRLPPGQQLAHLRAEVTSATKSLLYAPFSTQKREELPALVTVEPDFIIRGESASLRGPMAYTPETPDDPLLYAEWGLRLTHVFETWEGNVAGQSTVHVAVVDSGFDPQQKDLQHHLASWSSAFCDSTDPKCDVRVLADPTGHGTAMAGIIGADSDNEFRISGINQAVGLLNLKVLGTQSLGNIWAAASAIQYAVAHGVQVVSAAWGGPCRSKKLLLALRAAQENGVLVVAAAGNQGRSLEAAGPAEWDFYPAKFAHESKAGLHNLLVVGATGATEDYGTRKVSEYKAGFSNWGPDSVDLGAPGVGIITTGLETTWGVTEVNGTSPATAFVVGAAALVASQLSDCTPSPTANCYSEIKDRLLKGADQLKELCGCFEEGRRLNVYNAVFDKTGLEVHCNMVPPACP